MDIDGGLSWAINVAANELGRMPRKGQRTEYGDGAYDAVHRVLRRLMSVNGEAIETSDTSADAVIPTLGSLHDHNRAIRYWKSADPTDGIYKQPAPRLPS